VTVVRQFTEAASASTRSAMLPVTVLRVATEALRRSARDGAAVTVVRVATEARIASGFKFNAGPVTVVDVATTPAQLVVLVMLHVTAVWHATVAASAIFNRNADVTVV
jgi:hypothetical protein